MMLQSQRSSPGWKGTSHSQFLNKVFEEEGQFTGDCYSTETFGQRINMRM